MLTTAFPPSLTARSCRDIIADKYAQLQASTSLLPNALVYSLSLWDVHAPIWPGPRILQYFRPDRQRAAGSNESRVLSITERGSHGGWLRKPVPAINITVIQYMRPVVPKWPLALTGFNSTWRAPNEVAYDPIHQRRSDIRLYHGRKGAGPNAGNAG